MKPFEAEEDQHSSLEKKLREQVKRFIRARNRWNRLYYTSMYGSIVLSALAAVILKLKAWEGVWQEDVAALCAMLAAILGTAMTAGGFERRWAAARRALATVQRLELKWSARLATDEWISEQMDILLAEYTEWVVGDVVVAERPVSAHKGEVDGGSA
jgi:hypothetical protein